MTGVGAKAPPAPVPFPACQISDSPLPTFGRLLAAEGVPLMHATGGIVPCK